MRASLGNNFVIDSNFAVVVGSLLVAGVRQRSLRSSNVQ
jgi:hypothetical protein